MYVNRRCSQVCRRSSAIYLYIFMSVKERRFVDQRHVFCKKFNSTSVQALENLVREGKLDRLMHSKIERDSKWSALFGSIPTPTFRSRLGRTKKIRKWRFKK